MDFLLQFCQQYALLTLGVSFQALGEWMLYLVALPLGAISMGFITLFVLFLLSLGLWNLFKYACSAPEVSNLPSLNHRGEAWVGNLALASK